VYRIFSLRLEIILVQNGKGVVSWMQIIIKGKNIELTPALRTHAEKKVGKIAKFFEDNAGTATVMLRTERDLHIVEVTVQIEGLILRGEEKTDDMYVSIDGVVDKLERQIKKYKTRINHKLRLDVESKTPEVKEEEPREPVGQVIKTKRFAVKPMSVEEAVMQLELIGHDFFVFRNATTEEVNVLYRRTDGNFGLIEPGF
jgi:putative sigma-54 modulation protein